jgi:hypothetical protein
LPASTSRAEAFPEGAGELSTDQGAADAVRRPAILIVHVEVAEEDAEELNRWYEEEHRPEKMALPGYVGMRRFRAFEGAPSFLAIYELTEPEAAVHTAPGPPPSDWMKAVMDKWKHWDRSIWVELMTP